MRLLFNIFAAISTLLLLLVLTFWVRSYSRYEGILHYADAPPVMVKAHGNGRTVEDECAHRSSGWVSFPGQLTYLSIANPVLSSEWESWSAPVDSFSGWAPVLAADAFERRGLRAGSMVTLHNISDPINGISWQLPYWYFTVPYWMLAVVLAILPYRWVADYRWRARQRKQEPSKK